jgi:hypothetical protein
MPIMVAAPEGRKHADENVVRPRYVTTVSTARTEERSALVGVERDPVRSDSSVQSVSRGGRLNKL